MACHSNKHLLLAHVTAGQLDVVGLGYRLWV